MAKAHANLLPPAPPTQQESLLGSLLQMHCYSAAFVSGAFKLPPALLAQAQSGWREQKQSPVVSQIQRTVYHAFKPFVQVGCGLHGGVGACI